MRKNTRQRIKLLTLLFCTMLASACTPTIAQRGNMLEDYQINDVVLGVHTRTDVLRLLGSPTTTAPFDDTKWYYLGQKMSKSGIFDPEVEEERIVLVSFDKNGVVQTIEDIDTDRLSVPIEDDQTPTQGHETTIVKEFFGNLGRFNSPSDTNQ